MARYHVSEDGTPRVCTAKSPESCTAVGVDGDGAPHGEFSDAGEARRFAEHVLEESSIGNGLSGVRKPWDHPDHSEFNKLIGIDREATPGVPRLQDTPAAIIVDNVPPMEGWRKVGDFEDGDNGPHLVGPLGEVLMADGSGDGSWDLTDADGSEQGNYRSLSEALDTLDEISGFEGDDSYSARLASAQR